MFTLPPKLASGGQRTGREGYDAYPNQEWAHRDYPEYHQGGYSPAYHGSGWNYNHNPGYGGRDEYGNNLDQYRKLLVLEVVEGDEMAKDKVVVSSSFFFSRKAGRSLDW